VAATGATPVFFGAVATTGVAFGAFATIVFRCAATPATGAGAAGAAGAAGGAAGAAGATGAAGAAGGAGGAGGATGEAVVTVTVWVGGGCATTGLQYPWTVGSLLGREAHVSSPADIAPGATASAKAAAPATMSDFERPRRICDAPFA
jgi:hypothetical protein